MSTWLGNPSCPIHDGPSCHAIVFGRERPCRLVFLADMRSKLSGKGDGVCMLRLSTFRFPQVAHVIAVVKRVGTAPSHNCPKKNSVKREFLSLRVAARKMNDTNMMYKNLAIDCMYF